MRRVMALWLPSWPVDRWLLQRARSPRPSFLRAAARPSGSRLEAAALAPSPRPSPQGEREIGAAAQIPSPLGEREGPGAERREGEGAAAAAPLADPRPL